MPSPEIPIPDIKKELAELSSAQDAKLEVQMNGFKGLKDAEKKVSAEAGDILRIARENSSDPEKFILEAIKEYAKEEKISLLAAKAKVLQYLSPEWKEKVDAEVKEYFWEFDISKFVGLPEGSEEVETLKILCDESYMPYFMTVQIAYCQGGLEARKQNLAKFDKFAKTVKEMLERVEREPFGKKESFVLDPENTFPEARKYLEKVEKTKTKEEYEHIINLAYKYLILGRATEGEFPEFDCDATTLFLQKMAIDESLEIGNYMEMLNHVVLKLDGLPLVLDTFDMKIRTVEECARREGYGEKYRGSYFWRDDKEEYLAQYENSDHYPRKIVKYEKVERPYLAGSCSDMPSILLDLALLLRLDGKEEEAKKYYEKALKIDPNYAKAHHELALLLRLDGEKEEAKRHYEKALEIDPNDTIVHRDLAFLLRLDGEKEEAKRHYEKALEIDPNDIDACYSLAFILYDQGKFQDARGYLNKFDKLRRSDPFDYDSQFRSFDEKLKEKGY